MSLSFVTAAVAVAVAVVVAVDVVEFSEGSICPRVELCITYSTRRHTCTWWGTPGGSQDSRDFYEV